MALTDIWIIYINVGFSTNEKVKLQVLMELNSMIWWPSWDKAAVNPTHVTSRSGRLYLLETSRSEPTGLKAWWTAKSDYQCCIQCSCCHHQYSFSATQSLRFWGSSEPRRRAFGTSALYSRNIGLKSLTEDRVSWLENFCFLLSSSGKHQDSNLQLAECRFISHHFRFRLHWDVLQAHKLGYDIAFK